MLLIKKSADLRNWLEAQREKGKKAGFVPTMGALHPGHISLIRTCNAENDITACSIFVNPTQFNDPRDFEKYPVTLEKDILMLEQAGCNLLFLPSVHEIYPDGPENTRHYNLGRLENILEGKYRPGHFQGVCQVVDRLLETVNPSALYLGQKDFQQCMVIRRLLTLTGREHIQLRICPTLREEDGLAMSSRNMRLSGTERQTAPVIHRVLRELKAQLKPGPVEPLLQHAAGELKQAGLVPDYISISSALDLSPVDIWDGEEPVVALVAARLGEIRLIDNLLLN